MTPTNCTRRLLAELLVVGLLVALVGGSVALATASPTRLTLDADHALDTEEKQGEFERTGVATATIDAPSMSISVSTEHDVSECGISGWHSDLRNDYLCVTYDEEIDRTVRVYIPAEYWAPYVRAAVEPVKGDAVASFEPVEDAAYTSVTVTLSEPGTYAWPVTMEASWFSGTKDRNIERVENVTGVGVPDQQSWSYIEPSELGGAQSAYVVRAPNGTTNLVIEYKTGPEEWSAVPDEEKGYAPVYYTTKQGVDDRVYVFATTADPPEVRYKTEAGARDMIGSALREIGQTPARLEEILNIDIPFLGN